VKLVSVPLNDPEISSISLYAPVCGVLPMYAIYAPGFSGNTTASTSATVVNPLVISLNACL